MEWVKVFHFIFIFIWVGCLLTLSRLMMKHKQLEPAAQAALAPLYSRFYHFAQLPSMLIAVTLGLILISGLDSSKNLGWFHMKLTFAMAVIGLDIFFSRLVQRLNQGESEAKGAHLVHMFTGLCLVGIAISLYVVR